MIKLLQYIPAVVAVEVVGIQAVVADEAASCGLDIRSLCCPSEMQAKIK